MQKLPLLLLARRVREDQTFDLYAQRLEDVARRLSACEIDATGADRRRAALEEEIAAVRKAIAEVQARYVDINIERGL